MRDFVAPGLGLADGYTRDCAVSRSMLTCRCLGLALLGGCLVACRPTPATVDPGSARDDPAPSSTPATAPSPPSARSPEPASRPAAAPAAEGLPQTCEVTVELLDRPGLTGHGESTVSGAEAKEVAWADACAALRQATGLDCHDPDRVAVSSQSSRSHWVGHADGSATQSYDHAVTLSTLRRATGFGDAMDDRPLACRRAKAHACDQLVGGPCPTAGLRVVEVDGRPPRPAEVEPPRPAEPPSRRTI